MRSLGHDSNRWEFQAKLVGKKGFGQELIGDTTVAYKDGKAEYQTLSINKPGDELSIKFTVSNPTNVPSLTKKLEHKFR